MPHVNKCQVLGLPVKSRRIEEGEPTSGTLRLHHEEFEIPNWECGFPVLKYCVYFCLSPFEGGTQTNKPPGW